MNKQIVVTENETATYNDNSDQDLLKIHKVLDETQSNSISHIKRFYERWRGDKKFREQLFKDPYKAIEHYALKVNPEEIRQLWDLEYTKKHGEDAPVSSSLKNFREIFVKGESAKLKHSLLSFKESRFKAWRDRQIARTLSQFPKCHYDSIAHAPMCFELSKGCSVGCWFCGISAPRLGDIFIYNQENAKLWCEVLELMRGILGTAGGEGFCYWATDPLDNQDYEKFCSDFHEILGSFPQTTTAQALKNPERTRSLLKLSNEKGCKLNRFSILSLKILDRVHEEFSAEELASVYLVLQSTESDFAKANAGRARNRNKTKNKNSESDQALSQETIACVTGFLFNMVDRSVKLISPCPADDRWPNGYIIYDEGTFYDASSLKILLEEMVAKNMPLNVRYSDVIRFRLNLKYENLADGFQLSTKYLTRKFCNQPYLKELGEVIKEGNKTAKEIVLLFEKFGVPQANTLYSLNILFNQGVLDDEPQLNESKTNVKPEAQPIP